MCVAELNALICREGEGGEGKFKAEEKLISLVEE